MILDFLEIQMYFLTSHIPDFFTLSQEGAQISVRQNLQTQEGDQNDEAFSLVRIIAILTTHHPTSNQPWLRRTNKMTKLMMNPY